MIKIQVLTTPILNDIRTFDANKDHSVSFNVYGGGRVFANELVINRVSDNQLVYNARKETNDLNHVIPANTLINGIDYKARVRTEDSDELVSGYSDGVIFWCYSEPKVEITEGIGYEDQNRVYGQTVEFEATYIQSEYEVMESYRYTLYDDNKRVLLTFPEQYSTGSSVLTQEITNLENGTNYYLEVKTLSPSGNVGSTGLIKIVPFYLVPKLNVVVTPVNKPNEGAIKISANVIQVVLKLYDRDGNEVKTEDIEYLEDTAVDLNRWDYLKIVADEAFNIDRSDFIIRLWVKQLPKNNEFLTLYTNSGDIRLRRNTDYLTAYKSIRGLKARDYYRSNTFDALDSDHLMIQLMQLDGRLDIKVENLKEMI